VPGCAQHLQRPESIAFLERLVDGTRGVLRTIEPQPDLKGQRLRACSA